MKRVIAVIGTQTKRNTYRAVQEFEKNLNQLDEIDFEYVFLSDYYLDFCRGCKICFDKGEEHCPLKDDRDVLLEKVEQADGVIFATPNYAFQLSARMKNFFDRTAYLDHRPRFFGKVCTAIVTQGIGKGEDIIKYLNFNCGNMGFHISKGCCVNTLEPMTEVQNKKLVRKIQKTCRRFYKNLTKPTPPPSFFRLMMFRVSRPLVKSAGEKFKDYHYYKEKGWFDSAYYYDTSLGFPKKLAGYLFDLMGQLMAKQR